MGDTIIILVEFAIFALVVGMTVVVSRRLQTAALTGRRLRGEAKATDTGSPRASIVRDFRVKNPLLNWIQSSTSLKDDADRSKLEKDLRAAGFESPSAPALFFVARFSLAIGLPFLFLISQSFRSHPMTGLPLIFVALFLCGVSLILPQAVIDRMAQGRRDELEREFPDALDLMVVCVEAGLGIEAAFVRVGEEVAESHPRISQEFEMVSHELRAGRTRGEALRNLGLRTGVPAVNSFATLLIQTDALGASIGQTLRIYSQEMRETRFLKAEEKAMRIPVLMTVPLVACILPVIITALLLPAIIDVIRTLMPALSHHGH